MNCTTVQASLVLSLGLALAGCNPAPTEMPPMPPPLVQVSEPVVRYVTDYSDFTGRTAAVDSVEVRARVSGYLEKVNFKEGALVKKGQVIFEIDDRVYQAALEQAQAKVMLDESQLKLAESEFRRVTTLRSAKSASQDEFDKARTARDVALSSVAASKADLARRQLDVDFTKVTAPISGRIGRAIVTEGNLVQSGDQGGGTLLTTIVSVDPIYAYFDVDERTVLRVQQMIREGKVKSARNSKIDVKLGLATEDGLPHTGTIDFVDNQVNPKTGTLRVRGVFPNKKEILSPGLFARVRVPIGEPYKAVLIADRAIDSDQGKKIVFVVNDKNEVLVRPVRVGAIHDNLRVVEDGVKAGERVIVEGIQQVRAGLVVEPKLIDMPGNGK